MTRLTILAGPALAGIIGCSTNTTPAEVQLPHSLSFASISVAGSPVSSAWTPENTTGLTLSCDNAPLLVETDPKPVDSAIDGFTLAVAGNCGTNISCGWLVLRVASNDGMGVDIATASTPIAVLGVNQPGSYTFSLELHDALDNTLHAPDVGEEVQVELLPPASCPASTVTDAG